MIANLNNKSLKYLLVYYAILLMVFLSWHNPVSFPPAVLRIAYMVAVFAPILIWGEKWWLAPIVVLFNSLAHFGYTSSYMPSMGYTYIIFVIFALLLLKGYLPQSSTKVSAISLLAVILFFTSIIDIISAGQFSSGASGLLLTLLIATTIKIEDNESCQLLSYSLIVTALILSLQFILMRSLFVELVTYGNGLEREGFKDINYSSCVISLGVMACLIQIFTGKVKGKILHTILIYGTIAISMSALAMNASRASFLSVAMCFAVLIFMSKTKLWQKVLIVAAVFALLFYLFNSGLFDLLLYRVQNEDKTGSRAEIWSQMLNGFFGDGNIFNYFMGMGMENGRMAGNVNNSTHNDFVSFLIYYGIIGFCIFVAFFTYPYRKADKQNKIVVAAGTLGLLVTAFTLEPFAKGMIPYYGFWLYLLCLAKQPSIEIEESNNRELLN